MKLSWLFNGTLEAHHLAAVYLTVWVVQGGYAIWVARQWMRTAKESAFADSGTRTPRDRR
jgi:hypothetical protein